MSCDTDDLENGLGDTYGNLEGFDLDQIANSETTESVGLYNAALTRDSLMNLGELRDSTNANRPSNPSRKTRSGAGTVGGNASSSPDGGRASRDVESDASPLMDGNKIVFHASPGSDKSIKAKTSPRSSPRNGKVAAAKSGKQQIITVTPPNKNLPLDFGEEMEDTFTIDDTFGADDIKPFEDGEDGWAVAEGAPGNDDDADGQETNFLEQLLKAREAEEERRRKEEEAERNAQTTALIQPSFVAHRRRSSAMLRSSADSSRRGSVVQSRSRRASKVDGSSSVNATPMDNDLLDLSDRSHETLTAEEREERAQRIAIERMKYQVFLARLKGLRMGEEMQRSAWADDENIHFEQMVDQSSIERTAIAQWNLLGQQEREERISCFVAQIQHLFGSEDRQRLLLASTADLEFEEELSSSASSSASSSRIAIEAEECASWQSICGLFWKELSQYSSALLELCERQEQSSRAEVQSSEHDAVTSTIFLPFITGTESLRRAAVESEDEVSCRRSIVFAGIKVEEKFRRKHVVAQHKECIQQIIQEGRLSKTELQEREEINYEEQLAFSSFINDDVRGSLIESVQRAEESARHHLSIPQQRFLEYASSVATSFLRASEKLMKEFRQRSFVEIVAPSTQTVLIAFETSQRHSLIERLESLQRSELATREVSERKWEEGLVAIKAFLVEIEEEKERIDTIEADHKAELLAGIALPFCEESETIARRCTLIKEEEKSFGVLLRFVALSTKEDTHRQKVVASEIKHWEKIVEKVDLVQQDINAAQTKAFSQKSHSLGEKERSHRIQVEEKERVARQKMEFRRDQITNQGKLVDRIVRREAENRQQLELTEWEHRTRALFVTFQVMTEYTAVVSDQLVHEEHKAYKRLRHEERKSRHAVRDRDRATRELESERTAFSKREERIRQHIVNEEDAAQSYLMRSFRNGFFSIQRVQFTQAVAEPAPVEQQQSVSPQHITPKAPPKTAPNGASRGRRNTTRTIVVDDDEEPSPSTSHQGKSNSAADCVGRIIREGNTSSSHSHRIRPGRSPRHLAAEDEDETNTNHSSSHISATSSSSHTRQSHVLHTPASSTSSKTSRIHPHCPPPKTGARKASGAQLRRGGSKRSGSGSGAGGGGGSRRLASSRSQLVVDFSDDDEDQPSPPAAENAAITTTRAWEVESTGKKESADGSPIIHITAKEEQALPTNEDEDEEEEMLLKTVTFEEAHGHHPKQLQQNKGSSPQVESLNTTQRSNATTSGSFCSSSSSLNKEKRRAGPRSSAKHGSLRVHTTASSSGSKPSSPRNGGGSSSGGGATSQQQSLKKTTSFKSTAGGTSRLGGSNSGGFLSSGSPRYSATNTSSGSYSPLAGPTKPATARLTSPSSPRDFRPRNTQNEVSRFGVSSY